MNAMNSLTNEELGSTAQRERRRRILVATTELASEGGFDAVQMRAVSERADVALGTLYRYFPPRSTCWSQHCTLSSSRLPR
ncbi:TetR family transcriptional regulator [Nocardioides alcanivorans]|uniref:TetR family transcriptional regulator n=1 Tax=Nocardioides alcanivorans TaxID=2897352 RepID=UPI001F43C575|nr:TetR family transcriptional regulator [Nocardioides alcanivorans]